MRAMYKSIGKVVLAAMIIAAPRLVAAEPTIHEADGASYISGGVGDEERRAIEAMGQRFNLKVTMALSSGHFVGDTEVRIRDSKGHTLIDTRADGPLLYAKLEPGTYDVSCTYNGREIKRSANITSGKQEQLAFTWPSE